MAVKRNLHRYYACDWRNLPEHRAITAWQASHVTGVLEGWRKQSNAHPEYHSALVTPIQMPVTKLGVAEFLSKGQRRSFANRILCYIYICIYVHVCACVYISAGDAVWDAVSLADIWQSSWQSLAPSPRNEKASSFQCRAGFHRRLSLKEMRKHKDS